jgi:hypothetical protein
MKNTTTLDINAVAALPAAARKPTSQQTTRGGCRAALIGLILMAGALVAQQNTATGTGALSSTTGVQNTADGFGALGANVGGQNTATGTFALNNNSGNENTATGANTLWQNSGNGNTATGSQSLELNSTGSYNTATGLGALLQNQTGSYNTATGAQALNDLGSGMNNTATGQGALQQNQTGNDNTATGLGALTSLTSGKQNTATGLQALLYSNGSYNTAEGFGALYNSAGNSNIALGYEAGYYVGTGSNNIEIGNQGLASDSGVIRIGTAGAQNSFFAAGIYGVNVSGVNVLVSSTGQLGVASSSRRYKEDIQDMGDATADLMRLRPVTFRYKEAFEDGSKPIQYGLIAEEVEEVYPDLVAHSADGRIETVKYQVLDSMLLNEVQRQEKVIQALEERLARLEAAAPAGSR